MKKVGLLLYFSIFASLKQSRNHRDKQLDSHCVAPTKTNVYDKSDDDGGLQPAAQDGGRTTTTLQDSQESDVFNAIYKNLEDEYFDTLEPTRWRQRHQCHAAEPRPYTVYYPVQAERPEDDAHGQVCGIGRSSLQLKLGRVWHREPYEKTRRRRKVLKKGDIIRASRGEDMTQKTMPT